VNFASGRQGQSHLKNQVGNEEDGHSMRQEKGPIRVKGAKNMPQGLKPASFVRRLRHG